MRIAAIILLLPFLVAASPVAADMRGQVVCGVPPDEAVAYVRESRGSWAYLGTLGRMWRNNYPTAEEALEAHAPANATDVCDVEIMDNLRRRPVRL